MKIKQGKWISKDEIIVIYCRHCWNQHRMTARMTQPEDEFVKRLTMIHSARCKTPDVRVVRTALTK